MKQWSNIVNTDAFNVTPSHVNNTITVKYDGGREVRYSENTSSKMAYTFSIMLGKAELIAFKQWYIYTIQGGVYSFIFPDLSGETTDMVEYKMTSVPKYEDAEEYTRLTIDCEEV